MHELSIAENIIEIVAQAALNAKALKVSRIVLDIGRLSGIETEALRFAMNSMVIGSVAEGAEIVYRETDGFAHCLDCNHDSILNELFALCPHCNSNRLEIIRGQEMKVAAIDIETED